MGLSTFEEMQHLQLGLKRRSETIKKAACLDKISFGPVLDTSFTVKTWWRNGELIKVFHHSAYFKSDGSALMRPCQVTRMFIQEILSHRGI